MLKEEQDGAGRAHPGELREGGLRVRERAQDERRDHRVEARAAKRQAFAVGDDEGSRGGATPPCEQHTEGEVDGDDATAGREHSEVAPGAGGDIEDAPPSSRQQPAAPTPEQRPLDGSEGRVVPAGRAIPRVAQPRLVQP